MAIFAEVSEDKFVAERHPLSEAIIVINTARYLANYAR